MKTVNLKTCSNEIEAEMLKSVLEAEGIKCFLSNVTMSGYPPMSGVDVHVSEEDYPRAYEIAKASAQAKEETENMDKAETNLNDILTHALFYFIGFPAVMMLIDMFTGRDRGWLYYVVQGFFFSLFMSAFRYFEMKRGMRKK